VPTTTDTNAAFPVATADAARPHLVVGFLVTDQAGPLDSSVPRQPIGAPGLDAAGAPVRPCPAVPGQGRLSPSLDSERRFARVFWMATGSPASSEWPRDRHCGGRRRDWNSAPARRGPYGRPLRLGESPGRGRGGPRAGRTRSSWRRPRSSSYMPAFWRSRRRTVRPEVAAPGSSPHDWTLQTVESLVVTVTRGGFAPRDGR